MIARGCDLPEASCCIITPPEEIILAARLRGGIRIGAPLDDPSMAQLDELLVPPAGATLPSTSEMEQENYDLFK